VSRRVLLVGATGAFGRRLAVLLSTWPDLTLILAARREGPLQALAADLAGCAARLEVAGFDRTAPDGLLALAPWAVVDAAGPFQGGDLALPRAAIAAGAHYVDLADARDFVAAFPVALDAEATAKGVLAVAGASSTPALSNAVLDRLTAGWSSIDTVTVAISPGARAPRGLSVMRAILSYVGRPVRLFAEGRWGVAPGWSRLTRLDFPGLGRRWAALSETPDLDLLPARFAPRRQALFLAGLELSVMHLGLWLLAWPVRLGVIRSLEPLARPLLALAGLMAWAGSDRGGMVVEAGGQGASGQATAARWSLRAEAGAGPYVPAAAAAAVLRGLVQGRIAARGAMACVDLLADTDILAEIAHLPIRTNAMEAWPDHPALLRRLAGAAFDALPAAVRTVHAGETAVSFRGRGRARGGRSVIPSISRGLVGLPEPGAYPILAVTIAPDGPSEVWTRDFGGRRFTSRLTSLPALGEFEEALGPLRFRFDLQAAPHGFRWRLQGWRLGFLSLPKALAPRIRATTFARDGTYRFRVLVAHPWLGVIFGYAGRLDT
jgi:hypothetical protein